MNGCDEIRDRLLSHHEGALGAEERRRVEAHLATCRECAREAREFGQSVNAHGDVSAARGRARRRRCRPSELGED